MPEAPHHDGTAVTVREKSKHHHIYQKSRIFSQKHKLNNVKAFKFKP